MTNDMLPYLKGIEPKKSRVSGWMKVGATLALLGAGYLGFNELVKSNVPEVYRTGYRGKYKVHVVEPGEKVASILDSYGHEGEHDFWENEIEKETRKHNPKFNKNMIYPGDTVYIPTDMKIGQE